MKKIVASSGQFPSTRLRRPRLQDWSRRMAREHVLTTADLIWPLFVREGSGAPEAVKTLPGVFRYSIEDLVKEAKEAHDLGIPAIAVFPRIDSADKDEDGTMARNPDNLVCRAVKAVCDAVPEIGIITDVALDPFTTHGHDGVIRNGMIANDDTVEILVEQALVQAQAGASIIAPSDMMDGRVGAIRKMLDAHGYENVLIMSYAAKYASAFYGPFRDAVGAGKIAGNVGKDTYQMDPANSDEAMREIELDIQEGADFVMVKPGMPYLDIIQRASQRFDVPIFAYQVSGEYAMIEAAAAAGGLDRDRIIAEALICFRRAGCRGILTYHAKEMAQRLND
ncbi:MAG: porphobilinogen synthase [Alphaproteobacteria bacterium]|nr:porphobilinogen synthase [Alphaproteobacteria bacterium]